MSESEVCATSQDPPAVSPKPHVLIIGAGITGLVLAQALKKHGIAFSVFERDCDVSARGRGWGLTIHWSLDTFISLLPQHIVDKLPQVYVDPEASKRGENGNFLFFDLRTGETRYKVPPNKRIRVSRERLRALLLEGLDVQVHGPKPSNQSLTPITIPSSPTLQILLRLPVRCLLEPMDPAQLLDRCCWPMILAQLSTRPCPCGFWVPVSSIRLNSLSA
ncbi:MAG: hypothetical protein Q9183_002415 [Haloplaca sp. 2 TL-2023]